MCDRATAGRARPPLNSVLGELMHAFRRAALSLWRHDYMRWMARTYGVRRTTAILTAVGFLIALLIMAPINLLTGGSLFTGVIVSAVICATVVPYHVYQIASVLRDLDIAREQLAWSAMHDDLTRSFNRRYFLAALDAACAARDRPSQVALLLVDIDHFKSINDTYGHQIGDLALRAVSERCQACLRAGDTFARYGGEEFVCLLQDASAEQAAEVAERLRQRIEQDPFVCGGERLMITVSVGGNIVPLTSADPAALIASADRALYTAKHLGRNRVCVA